LLLLQPTSATVPTAMAQATRTPIQAPLLRVRDLPGLALTPITLIAIHPILIAKPPEDPGDTRTRRHQDTVPAAPGVRRPGVRSLAVADQPVTRLSHAVDNGQAAGHIPGLQLLVASIFGRSGSAHIAQD